MDSYAGMFSLAAPVEENRVGTIVKVTVSARRPSRLVLEFREHHQVLADARVLLCGHNGARVLLELGYTGPLARRPRLTGQGAS